MITRIEATRYRCFDKFDVELGDSRAIVGANCSGKTTLLDVPVLLGGLLRERTISEALVYGQIAPVVSTANCVAPAFRRIRDTLRAWFPAEGV